MSVPLTCHGIVWQNYSKMGGPNNIQQTKYPCLVSIMGKTYEIMAHRPMYSWEIVLKLYPNLLVSKKKNKNNNHWIFSVEIRYMTSCYTVSQQFRCPNGNGWYKKRKCLHLNTNNDCKEQPDYKLTHLFDWWTYFAILSNEYVVVACLSLLTKVIILSQGLIHCLFSTKMTKEGFTWNTTGSEPWIMAVTT